LGPTESLENTLDSGPRDRAGNRERVCIVGRVVRPVDEMIRFVVDPEGTVVPDIKRRLPGRGVWVTAAAEIVGMAAARNAFARGFKRPVKAPRDLVVVTDRLLEAAALDALSIAHKAGLVRTGFAKVEGALAHGQAAALLHAAEAAPDGVRKLAAAARRDGAPNEPLPTVTAFTGAQLDLALGRLNVVHAALLAGPASDGFLKRWRTLHGFRAVGAGQAAPDPRE
jgi:hypothetical protein